MTDPQRYTCPEPKCPNSVTMNIKGHDTPWCRSPKHAAKQMKRAPLLERRRVS